ncbi:hypothetical protein MNB_SV-5-1201 [hydrothermal vent metagenome]|uniref:Cytochrome c domain-containing protein n=1 Tax=hydrothermal vent metagenome TaxID=652676 RepID=A0A1W1EDJ8_9ZZZZ
MLKRILLISILIGQVINPLYGENIYEKNCIPCHANLPTSLQEMFMSYLASYSGEKNVKTILKYYLKRPSKSLTVMSNLFIDTYGIKSSTKLNDKELDEAISIYWEKFKVFDKLK